MAWTSDVIHKNVSGALRQQILSCTADAAESNIETGLSVVYGHAIAPGSLTAGEVSLRANVNSSGTASNGYIGASGFTSGDVFTLVVWGK